MASPCAMLLLHLHSRHRNTKYPSSVVLFSCVVRVEWQWGQFIAEELAVCLIVTQTTRMGACLPNRDPSSDTSP
jgi:hypothetical protein